MIIGRPKEGEKFLKRNEVFFRFWPRLESLLNSAFARKFETEKPEDEVVFRLGRVAVEDFLELLLLAGNGYGFGAMKLLRSCYELTVTCGYLAKHPEEVRPYLEFHHVNEWRALEHFRSLDVDPRGFLAEDKFAQIEADFQRVKGQFRVACDRCGKTRMQPSWSKLDMASMAKDLGIGQSYPMMYFWPTMQSHASTYRLVSHFTETCDGATFEQGPQPQQADAALAFAFVLMAMLIEFQEGCFNLGLRDELQGLLTEYNRALQDAGPPAP